MSSHVYLLIGKEAFLKREFIQDLRKRLLSSGAEAQMNFQEFSGPKQALGPVFDFLQTAPFLGAHRMAVVSEADSLTSDDKEKILAFLPKLLPSSCLVLVSEQTNAKKDSFLAELSKKAKLVPCHPPFEKDLPGWLKTRAQRLSKTVDASAMTLIFERVGKELGALQAALEALAVFVHPKEVISAADVKAFLGHSAEEDVFGLVDLILQKNTASAVKKLEHLFSDGVRAQEIIPLLGGQLERLKKASQWMASGRSAAEVANELKVHPFFQNQFFAQAKKLSSVEFQRISRQLLDCEESVKRGLQSETLALEKFLLEACGELGAFQRFES